MPLEYHEPREQLPAEVIDQHRAVASLIEELEATMWYHQRAAVCPDAELKAVLEHNRDEEIEHAMMNLEWIRRNFPQFQEKMQIYLFKTGSIVALEAESEAGSEGEAGGSEEPGDDASAGSLNIGPMR